MLRCAAPPAARLSIADRRFCSSTIAASRRHRKLFAKRRSSSCRVLASAVSFTSKGLTVGTSNLPPSIFADVGNNIVHASPGVHHVFKGSGAGSAATATSELVAAVGPPAQLSLAGRIASTCQHVLRPAIAAAHIAANAADTGWRQLLRLARSGTFTTALTVVIGGAVVLLLALRLWRQLRKGHRQQAQAAQREAAAAQLASQRQRIMLALEEHVEDVPAAPLMQTSSFDAILEDYRSLLDNTVPTLDADGLPLGEAMINPLYNDADSQEVQQQWADFVAGAKLTSVRSDAWWDIKDTEEQPGVVADDIDWNA